MTPELTVLALAGLLQAVQFAIFALPANVDLTPKYTSGRRDTPPPRPMSKTTARRQRALHNHFEGLILFTIAVVVVTLGQQSAPVTHYAVYAYLTARVLYVPAYAFGLAPWRSVIWAVGFGATVLMSIAALI